MSETECVYVWLFACGGGFIVCVLPDATRKFGRSKTESMQLMKVKAKKSESICPDAPCLLFVDLDAQSDTRSEGPE